MAARDSRPGRKIQPSARLLNEDNGAAPNVAHQAALAAKPVLALIKKLTTLSKALPDSVPTATEEDDIRRIMTEVTGDDPQQTFVRRFDIVFGMQTCDSEGHLTRIRRGALGMDCVLEYLNSIPWISTTIELSVVEPKLSQLIEEMERLCSPSPAAKPKAKKAPSGKETTDKSGKAQPKSKSKKADLPSNHRSGSGDESDTAYKPRKARCVSEEEEDDFEGEDASDDDAEPKTKKRKRVIIDGEETTLHQKAGKRAKKGTKKSTSSAPSGPTIDLTEIDDDKLDEGNTNGKKGPKNTSRVHFHDPVAVKHQGERRWEFKCRHCSSVPFRTLRSSKKNIRSFRSVTSPRILARSTLRTSYAQFQRY
ncbi:hypothetical protein B0H10DRAFT_1953361 [Mycena sp. CBHHK59/15]|nr:hypothetical protein B0H10DRAFT_1953361 [Mycena sp. CBHHK59/15]